MRDKRTLLRLLALEKRVEELEKQLASKSAAKPKTATKKDSK